VSTSESITRFNLNLKESERIVFSGGAMAPAPVATGKDRSLSTTEGFICGGIAASIAVCTKAAHFKNTTQAIHSNMQVTVSNPAEVAKTRLQLQGELSKGGGEKVYKNAIDAFAKTWKNEGLRGMQRGLGPAVSPVCS
jgi:solute carrier family 25, member 34/35